MNRNLTTLFALSLAAVLIISVSGCGSSDSTSSTGSAAPTSGAGGGSTASGGAIDLKGAGSTFVKPAMSQWVYTYGQDHKDVTIDYQGVGSGAGISQYQAQTVDFGATDVPLADDDMAKTPTVQIPVALGCTVLAYNLPGIASGLKLTPEAISGIFLGKIKTWNDPLIAAENPGMKLPATPVSAAHRSDGSGTTYIFTDYLCSISPDWAKGPGKGKTVNWPNGPGGKGSDGVAGLIKATPGCIGYVELAYAVQNKLTYGPVKNKSGAYIEAGADGTSAAAAGALAAMQKDNRVSIVNSADKTAYPIAGFTYVILSKEPKDAVKAKALVAFLKWCVGDGQAMAAKLQYAPLPKQVVELDDTALDSATGSK
jgi:phosphate transport system substrate-binding protein